MTSKKKIHGEIFYITCTVGYLGIDAMKEDIMVINTIIILVSHTSESKIQK